MPGWSNGLAVSFRSTRHSVRPDPLEIRVLGTVLRLGVANNCTKRRRTLERCFAGEKRFECLNAGTADHQSTKFVSEKRVRRNRKDIVKNIVWSLLGLLINVQFATRNASRFVRLQLKHLIWKMLELKLTKLSQNRKWMDDNCKLKIFSKWLLIWQTFDKFSKLFTQL